MIKVEENYATEFYYCGDIDHTRKYSKVEPSDGHIFTTKKDNYNSVA